MAEIPRFAEWLTVSMDNQGLSGRKLAKLLGSHDTAVSKWKSGAAVPSVQNLMRMAEVFEVPPTRLLVTARPDEFSERDFGPPLEVPARHAYRAKIREHIRSLPVKPQDAKELEELFLITQLMRDGEGGPMGIELQRASDAIERLRNLVRGTAGNKATQESNQ